MWSRDTVGCGHVIPFLPVYECLRFDHCLHNSSWVWFLINAGIRCKNSYTLCILMSSLIKYGLFYCGTRTDRQTTQQDRQANRQTARHAVIQTDGRQTNRHANGQTQADGQTNTQTYVNSLIIFIEIYLFQTIYN